MKVKEVIPADGDCFVVAGKFLMENPNLPVTLVHAMVTGQGAIRGVRHAHAWVEIGDVVIDKSNGKNVIMRKEMYYNIGKVKTKPGQYASYDYDGAIEKMTDHMTYGPWDLSNK